MRLYFWLLHLVAFFGHKKARMMVKGQKNVFGELKEWRSTVPACEVVWFHAASVGEFEQARPIIEKLYSQRTDVRILLTFYSPSGYEMRKNYPNAHKVTYLPFATQKNAKKFLEIVKPSMAVFIKYEFWPAYLKALHKNHIPTYIIAATFRPKQLFFQPWGKGYRNLLKCFTCLYVQSKESLQLLQQYGINHVEVAGDTRFDRVQQIADQAQPIPVIEDFVQKNNGKKVIVAGSTWAEDEMLLDRFLQQHEDVVLILVPHEVNVEHLREIFQTFHGRFVRYTEATPANIGMCRVLMIDTLGMLSRIYQYADTAYIGGGFGVGIHNTLEAAVYGTPVIFGPHYHKFREAKGLIQAGAAKSVHDYDTFAQAMTEALEQRQTMGQCAKDYVISELGATEYIFNKLFCK